MTQIITATFEDGVLKPNQTLNLPDHAQVRLTIELFDHQVGVTVVPQDNRRELGKLG